MKVYIPLKKLETAKVTKGKHEEKIKKEKQENK